MTLIQLSLLTLTYISRLWAANLGSEEFDSNAFIFWNKGRTSLRSLISVNNYFCMGIIIRAKVVVAPGVCFHNALQQDPHPQHYGVYPSYVLETLDVNTILETNIYEVTKIYFNVSWTPTTTIDSGVVLLLLAKKIEDVARITKFLTIRKLTEAKKCKTLVWSRDYRDIHKSKLKPYLFPSSKVSSGCGDNLTKGEVCVGSKIKPPILPFCQLVRGILLQCEKKMQGFSGYRLRAFKACVNRNSSTTIPAIYIDISDHIFHIFMAMLSLSDTDRGNCLKSSKFLIVATGTMLLYYRIVCKSI